MQRRPFKQVDVFTREPFLGNPVAVVLQADGLSAAQMQHMARWTNLSETVFVLAPGDAQAHYRVRMFTPGAEIPFAGHPTIGAAHALLEAGLVHADDGVLVQECGAGLVRLEITRHAVADRWIAFDLPQPKIALLDDAQVEEIESLLGAPVLRAMRPRVIDVGARWIVAQLEGPEAVLALRPDLQRLAAHDARAGVTGVTVFGEHPPGAAARLEVRSFAPSQGIPEDPVCGSGNGCVAVFVRETSQLSHLGSDFLVAQGSALGRAGRLRLRIEPQRVQVAGMAVTCIDGTIAA
jgi:PhzF family phenazine biosynthesis protein